jgi:hypothetical protein
VSGIEVCPFLASRGSEGAIEYCASLERTRGASTSSAGKFLTAGSAVILLVVVVTLNDGTSVGLVVGGFHDMAGYSSGLKSLEGIVWS